MSKRMRPPGAPAHPADAGPAADPGMAGGREARRHGSGDRVGYLLKRAQHALRLEMDAVLAPLALSTAQYAVLSALEAAAEAGTPALSGAELARHCFVTPQTMTGLVAGLEARHLVRRRPHATHGRVLEVAMTADGRATLARAHGAVAAVETRLVADRTPGECAQLAQWLHACIRRLEGGAV